MLQANPVIVREYKQITKFYSKSTLQYLNVKVNSNFSYSHSPFLLTEKRATKSTSKLAS